MAAATITQYYPAHKLEPAQRQDLALKLIKNEAPVSSIAKNNNVSRKFLYHQKDKALAGIDSEFNKADDSDVIFHLTVTKTWLRSFTLCLQLNCRSSIRGVQKILSDCFDYQLSIGTISIQAKSAAIIAKSINLAQDLSHIKTYRTR